MNCSENVEIKTGKNAVVRATGELHCAMQQRRSEVFLGVDWLFEALVPTSVFVTAPLPFAPIWSKDTLYAVWQAASAELPSACPIAEITAVPLAKERANTRTSTVRIKLFSQSAMGNWCSVVMAEIGQGALDWRWNEDCG